MKTIKTVLFAILAIATTVSCHKSEPAMPVVSTTTIEQKALPIGSTFPDFSWEITNDEIIDYQIVTRAELLRSKKAFCFFSFCDEPCHDCKTFISSLNYALNIDGMSDERFENFIFIVAPNGETTFNVTGTFAYPVKTVWAYVPDEDNKKITGGVHPIMYICDKNAVIKSIFSAPEGGYPSDFYFSDKWHRDYYEDIREAIIAVLEDM